MKSSRYGPWLAKWTEAFWSEHSYQQALCAISFLDSQVGLDPVGVSHGKDTPRESLTRFPTSRRSLDLGCGTGRAMEVFLNGGWEAEGLDESPDMLRIARARLFPSLETHQAHLHAGRFQAGLPKGPFDAVTAFYNTLNHLTTVEEIARLAQGIHASLSPGGWCLGDLNTSRGFSTWHGRETSLVEGWAIEVWRHFDPTTGRALLRVSGTREGDSFEETIENQAHELRVFEECFRLAGFKEIGFSAPNSTDVNLEDPEAMGRVFLKARA